MQWISMHRHITIFAYIVRHGVNTGKLLQTRCFWLLLDVLCDLGSFSVTPPPPDLPFSRSPGVTRHGLRCRPRCATELRTAVPAQLRCQDGRLVDPGDDRGRKGGVSL